MPDKAVEKKMKKAPQPNSHKDQPPNTSVNMADRVRMVSRPEGVAPLRCNTPAPSM